MIITQVYKESLLFWENWRQLIHISGTNNHRPLNYSHHGIFQHLEIVIDVDRLLSLDDVLAQGMHDQK